MFSLRCRLLLRTSAHNLIRRAPLNQALMIRAPSPLPERTRKVPVKELVKRTCRCKSACFQQFDNDSGIEAIERARSQFRALDPGMQDVSLACHFWDRSPLEQSDLAQQQLHTDRSAVFQVSEDEGSGIAPSPTQDASENSARAAEVCRGVDETCLGVSGVGGHHSATTATETFVVSDVDESMEGETFGDSGSDDLIVNPVACHQAREVRDHPPKRRRWTQATCEKLDSEGRTKTFAGRTVCEHACARLFGVGFSRLQRVREGRSDGRTDKHPKHPLGYSLKINVRHKWYRVLQFFWILYHSVAEGLPNRLEVRASQSEGRLLDSSGEDGEPSSDDEEDRTRRCSAMAWHLVSNLRIEDQVNTGPGDVMNFGPKRYLPWGRPIEGYLLYRAYHRADPNVAGFDTWLRLHHKIFKSWLGYRKKNAFTDCDTCVDCKARCRSAVTIEDRHAAMEEYIDHLQSQFADRIVRWRFDQLSLQWFLTSSSVGYQMLWTSVSLSCLSADQDGMDQAKFCTPHRRGRHSKTYGKVSKLPLHIMGLWLHGFSFELVISDCDVPKDSNSQIEALARALTNVYRTTGQKLPVGFAYGTDNTVREAKNQKLHRFLICLVGLRIFAWALHGLLRPGHSHNGLDGCRPALSYSISACKAYA